MLEAKLEQPFAWSFNATDVRTSCVVEIVAEDGTTGWGECFGPARLNAAVVQAMRMHLIGKDPLATELHWQHLYSHFRDQGQKGLVITALSGIDIALWDLKGRRFEVPIHVLMGGPLRREISAYATGTYRLRSGNPLDYVVEEVANYVREGFHAVKVKIGFGVDEDERLIRAVRETIGRRVGLMLDVNDGFDVIEAVDSAAAWRR